MADIDHNITAQKNKRAVVIIFGVVIAMLGMSFASVPLYRLFCQATGLGGRAVQSGAFTGRAINRHVTIRFNTDVSPSLPWDFKAEQPPVAVQLGQDTAISFSATNRSDKAYAGSALYNIQPEAAGKYFHKTQCFCFDYQLIAPHKTAHFPVVFYIDPAIANDRQLDDLKVITLSYSFFPAESPELDKALEDFYKGKKSGTTSVQIKR